MMEGHARTAATVREGHTAALLALALAACGGAGPGDAAEPDFVVRGTGIVVSSTAAFTRSPDFPARVESTVAAALRYWGGDWSHLDGRTITFQGERHVECPGHAGAVGCFDGDIRVTTRDVAFTYACVEETALVHEIGHAVIGDAGHTDPRWLDFSEVAADLQGRRGYADGGEAACELYVSVWRHAPDSGRAPVALDADPK
jgi:hypothetical protein